MTRQTYNRGMALLAATWPDRKLEPKVAADALAAYWLVLQEMHDSVFEAAVAACLRECKFYPKPAEILAKAQQVLVDYGVLPKGPELAWEEVLGALRSGTYEGFGVGDYVYKHEWSHPAIAEAVKAIGGMERVGMTEIAELHFLRQRFMDHYEPRRRRVLTYDTHLLAAPLPTARQLASPVPVAAPSEIETTQPQREGVTV